MSRTITLLHNLRSRQLLNTVLAKPGSVTARVMERQLLLAHRHLIEAWHTKIR